MIFRIVLIFYFWFIPFKSISFDENSIVAVVNDSIITKIDLDKALQGTINRSAALMKLIDNEIINQNFSKYGLAINEDITKEILSEIALNNNLTLNQLSKVENFKEIKKNVIQKVTNSLVKDVIFRNKKQNITDQMIEKYMLEMKIPSQFEKQFKISIISIEEANQSESSKISTKKTIEKFKKDIESGKKTFEEIAKLYSNDPSYINGGSIDWSTKSAIPLDIISALKNLKTNQISPPIFINNNWLLIKLENIRSIDTSKINAKNKLLIGLKEKSFQTWLKNEKEKSFIKIFE